MHTHKEGVTTKNGSRKINNKTENKTQAPEYYSAEKREYSQRAVPEPSVEQRVFMNGGFTTLHEQDGVESEETCVLIDRITGKSQVLTNRAQVAANYAVRTAMATKNSIDVVEKVVRCMRKITSSMDDVIESVEKIGRNTQNIEKITDIEECIKTTGAAARNIEEGYKTANEARAAMDRVMDLVEEVSSQIDGIFEIADEVNAGSADVIRVIDNLVHEVTGSSRQLEKISGELNDHIERFQSYGKVVGAVAVRTPRSMEQSQGDREYSGINS